MKKLLSLLFIIASLTGLSVYATDLVIESKNQSFNEADNKIKFNGDVKVTVDDLKVVGENAEHLLKSDKNCSKFPNISGDNSYIIGNMTNKGVLTGGYENFLVREIETYEVIFNEDFSDDEQSDEY